MGIIIAYTKQQNKKHKINYSCLCNAVFIGTMPLSNKKIIQKKILQMLNMKKWFLNNKLIVIGVIIGGISGYLYYYFVGCSTGTCAISSNPYNSTLYFSILGGLLMGINIPKKFTEKEK